jgi:hypothetical protein
VLGDMGFLSKGRWDLELKQRLEIWLAIRWLGTLIQTLFRLSWVVGVI